MIFYKKPVQDMYDKVIDCVSYFKLYKIIKLNTKSVEINGLIEEKLMSRDWEVLFVQKENGLTIEDVRENFETIYVEALALEMETKQKEFILKARKMRWEYVSNKVFKNEIFSNLSAERNTSLMFQALYNYKKGMPIRWSNLDGTYVEINADNVEVLGSLYSEICTFHQLTFDCVDILIQKIKETKTVAELQEINIVAEWEDSLSKFKIEGKEVYA